MIKNLTLYASRSESFDILTVCQLWDSVKYATDACYSIINQPVFYDELQELKHMGYMPYENQVDRDPGSTTIACLLKYRIDPRDMTFWMMKSGRDVIYEPATSDL